MPRKRQSSNIANIANYTQAWMKFQAGEAARPKHTDFDIDWGDAISVQQQVERGIVRAYTEPESLPPNAERYGVTAERGQEIGDEIQRLLRKAHDKRHGNA